MFHSSQDSENRPNLRVTKVLVEIEYNQVTSWEIV